MQNSLGFQGVVADSVTLDDRGNDLVDPGRSGPQALSLPASWGGARALCGDGEDVRLTQVWLECRQTLRARNAPAGGTT